ncbi:MAG TPA: hypothetical protein VJ183_06545 [Chloroflexia bacterium]|nr:hypothetical protein [Chloroflexia bacterium]
MEESISPSTFGPALDQIREVVEKQFDEQNSHISALDTRAGFLITSASVFITGVGVAGKAVFDFGTELAKAHIILDHELQLLVLLLGFLVFASYLMVLISGLQAYISSRGRATLSELRSLRNNYLTEDEDTVKLVLLDTQIAIYEENINIVSAKSAATQRATYFLIFEAISGAALAILQLLLFTRTII